MNDEDQIKSSLNFPLSGNDSVYFIGIGGIGMSAIARYFRSLGLKVSGYDRTPTSLTEELEAEGMNIHYADDVRLVDKEAKLVVFTPAVPADHKELGYYRQHNYPVLKRSDVLGLITKTNFNICIAGTHGKTTTSAMVAHILRDSGFGCNAFLGGIASNYGTNFWSDPKKLCVAEADEYDRSFLKLRPDIAVITAMDADHLDIYGTEKQMQDAFVEFAAGIKTGGLLISRLGIARSGDFTVSNKLTYSADDQHADIYASDISINEGSYLFDVHFKGQVVKGVSLNMGGKHNIENAVAAIAVAKEVGIANEAIIKAVASFAGVKRRFEYVVKNKQQVLIDDYAHHPEELKALIHGTRDLFPGRKLTVIFQPHLYSRTRDLADGFASVLSEADEIILLPVYPARELPLEGISSETILNKMSNSHRSMMTKDELLDWVASNQPELLITAGAGDIDTLVTPISKILNRRK